MFLEKWLFRTILFFRPVKPMTPEQVEHLKQKQIVENRTKDTDCMTLPAADKAGIEIQKVDLPNCTAWMFDGDGNDKDKVIYYIHGGGFTGAHSKVRFPLIAYMVRNEKCNVFSVDYRLAPEYMHPCEINDCLDGYKHLLTKYPAEKIVLIGESAGGNLVLSLSLLIKDKGLPQPAGICACSPVVQFSQYFDSFHKYSGKEDFQIGFGILEVINGIYFKDEEKECPYVAPLFGDVHGLPPVYLDADGKESLSDDAIHMYKKLKEAGVDTELHLFKGLWHASVVCADKKAVCKQVYPPLFSFVHRHLD